MELEYQAVEKAPMRMELVVEGERFVLVFALTPKWATMVGIVTPFSLGVFQSAFLAYLGWTFRSTSRWIGTGTDFPWAPFLLYWLGPLSLLGWSWWNWRSFRRNGHLSRRIYLDEAKGTLGERREGSERWREWPISTVVSARLIRLRGLLGQPAGAAMRIRLRGWPSGVRAQCGKKDMVALRGFVEEMRRVMPGKVQVAAGFSKER